MRVTLRQARLAAATVAAAVLLYGVAWPALHSSVEAGDAPLHGLGLCLVLFGLAGSFLVPRSRGPALTRSPARSQLAPNLPMLAPPVATTRTPAWLQRFLN